MTKRLVDTTLDELERNGEAEIKTGDSRLKAVLRRDIQDSWDISLHDQGRTIGYAVIMKDEGTKKWYQLENQADIFYKHKGMEDYFGWGIEVHQNYRGKKIGHTLLSLGIGMALRDFQDDASMTRFEVRADGIKDHRRFYERFGFKIDPHNPNTKTIIRGRYVKLFVPEIYIK